MRGRREIHTGFWMVKAKYKRSVGRLRSRWEFNIKFGCYGDGTGGGELNSSG
jgi:hypothetical protein